MPEELGKNKPEPEPDAIDRTPIRGETNDMIAAAMDEAEARREISPEQIGAAHRPQFLPDPEPKPKRKRAAKAEVSP